MRHIYGQHHSREIRLIGSPHCDQPPQIQVIYGLWEATQPSVNRTAVYIAAHILIWEGRVVWVILPYVHLFPLLPSHVLNRYA